MVAIFLCWRYKTGMLFVVGKVAPDFREYLRTHGIAYGVFANAASGTKESHQYAIDFTSPETIQSSLRQIQPAPEVTGVIITGYEHYVTPAAVIADYFKVPGIPLAAA